jgi:hypothetical protein
MRRCQQRQFVAGRPNRHLGHAAKESEIDPLRRRQLPIADRDTFQSVDRA